MSINNKEFSEFTKLKSELTYTWVANKKTNQDRRYIVYSFETSECCSLDLSTPDQCQKFAQHIGSYASDTLEHIRSRLIEEENINTSIIQQIDGTLKTIDRKIDKHVAEMVKTVQNMTLDVSKNEFKNNYVQPLFETMRRQALTEKQGIQTGVSPALPQSEEKYQAALNIIQVAEEYMNAALSSQEYNINLSELMSENHLAIISSPGEDNKKNPKILPETTI